MTVVADAALSAKQKQSIAEATARINLWHGSVRSGKTIASIIAWLHYVATSGPGPLLMVGKTKDTLERNIIEPMAALFGPLANNAVIHVRGANTATILGRLVYLVGANDAKSESRIRGLTLRGAYVDEASLIPEGFWAMLLSRLSLPGARLFATTNPDSPNHWLKRDFIDAAARLDLAVWHFELDDNPSLDPAYVSAIKAEYTGLWFQRFILGLWVLAEGAIYDMFDSTPGGRHVVSVLPEMRRWSLAVDYGTTNPFVALLMGVGVDDRLYVAREWRWDSKQHRRQLTDSQYSAELRQWLTNPSTGEMLPLDDIIVDPSAASFIVQLYEDGWQGVQGADNRVEDGIRSVSSLLAADRLRIHESCRGLIDEKVGYVWDPKKQERGEDAPLKVADHGPDAERYGVMGLRQQWRPWLVSELPSAA
jgi:PBSX family phage terminase large subunit